MLKHPTSPFCRLHAFFPDADTGYRRLTRSFFAFCSCHGATISVQPARDVARRPLHLKSATDLPPRDADDAMLMPRFHAFAAHDDQHARSPAHKRAASAMMLITLMPGATDDMPLFSAITDMPCHYYSRAKRRFSMRGAVPELIALSLSTEARARSLPPPPLLIAAADIQLIGRLPDAAADAAMLPLRSMPSAPPRWLLRCQASFHDRRCFESFAQA